MWVSSHVCKSCPSSPARTRWCSAICHLAPVASTPSRPAFTCTNHSSACHGSILCSNFDHGHVIMQEKVAILHLNFVNLKSRAQAQTIFVVSCVTNSHLSYFQFWYDCASQLLHRSGVFSSFPIVCQDPSTTRMQPSSGMLAREQALAEHVGLDRKNPLHCLVLTQFSILHFGAFMTMFWINCSSNVTFPTCAIVPIWAFLATAAPSCIILTRQTWISWLVCRFPLTVHGCSSGASSPAPSPGGNSSTRPSLPFVVTLLHVVAAIFRGVCEVHGIPSTRFNFRSSLGPHPHVYPYTWNSAARRM